MKITKNNLIQKEQYKFPYHYITQIFDSGENYKSYINWPFSFEYFITLRTINKTLDKINCKNYLDVGCGDGRLINYLASKKKKINFHGIDNDLRSISWAKNFNNLKNVKFKCQDISKLKKSNFDLISLIEVLEHIEPKKLKKFCHEVKKRLKVNGKLIITVPHVNKKLIPKHYQHFTFKKIYSYFSSNFQIVEIKGYPKKSLFWSVLDKIFCNRFWFFESNFINKLKVKQFKFIHKEQNSKRIFLYLKKNKKN